ncbi:MAG TPA: hypothetical protein VK436_00905, partial [Methanocella sp.]|nr:hypothetical protein [Methanocella sp.]
EALFLMYVGVSPAKSILVSLINLVPVLNLFPWCTLAVLHAKFGVRMGGLSKLFIEEKPHHAQGTLNS